MAAIISPYMNLPIPSVGTTPGPDYAINVDTCLTLIDQHDHTPGKGAPIVVAALNIDADLTMNSFALLDLSQIVFTASSSASTTPQSLSVAPGGESPQQQDLWYTPNTGVPIQITKNGAVNVVASSIDGETYAAGTFYWTQAQDALPTTPANFDIGSIVLRPNVALTMFGVELHPASAISSQYGINLPLLPVTKKILTLDPSGNMVADTDVDNSTLEIVSNIIRVKAQGITAAQILNNTITTNQISATAGILQSQLAIDAFALQSTTLTPSTPSFTVRVATVVNGTLATAFDNGSTVDGIVLATSDLILVKNQTTATENGIYVVQASGAPVRSTSYDTFGELIFANTTVTTGDANTGSNWTQTAILTSLGDNQVWENATYQEYTVPTGVNAIRVMQWAGGGGGGGGGGRKSTGAGGGGAGGGGAGGGQYEEISLSVTSASTLKIVLGEGGAGGLGGTSDANNATAGLNGGATTIYNSSNVILHRVQGGAGGGRGGGGNNGAGGAGNSTLIVAGGTGGTAPVSGGGGGGGGGGNTAARLGAGDGSSSEAVNGTSALVSSGGGGGAAVDGTIGSDGGAGGISNFIPTAAAGGLSPSDSGGGGGGGAAYGAGGAGGGGSSVVGADGTDGGGGGGGSGSTNSPSTGANGGRGGDGGMIIYYQQGA